METWRSASDLAGFIPLAIIPLPLAWSYMLTSNSR